MRTCGKAECDRAFVDLMRLRRFEEAVPPKYREAKLADFPKATRDAAWAGAPDDVIITGPPGIGKTHLAAAVCREVARHVRRIKWTRAPRLILEINASFSKRRESELDVVGWLEEVPYLVINDLGAENPTDRAASLIYDILDARGELRRHTLVTTNLSYARIQDQDPRLASRFLEYKTVKLEGRDRRKEARKR